MGNSHFREGPAYGPIAKLLIESADSFTGMQDQTRDGGLPGGSFDRQHQGSAQAFALA